MCSFKENCEMNSLNINFISEAETKTFENDISKSFNLNTLPGENGDLKNISVMEKGERSILVINETNVKDKSKPDVTFVKSHKQFNSYQCRNESFNSTKDTHFNVVENGLNNHNKPIMFADSDILCTKKILSNSIDEPGVLVLNSANNNSTREKQFCQSDVIEKGTRKNTPHSYSERDISVADNAMKVIPSDDKDLNLDCYNNKFSNNSADDAGSLCPVENFVLEHDGSSVCNTYLLDSPTKSFEPISDTSNEFKHNLNLFQKELKEAPVVQLIQRAENSTESDIVQIEVITENVPLDKVGDCMNFSLNVGKQNKFVKNCDIDKNVFKNTLCEGVANVSFKQNCEVIQCKSEINGETLKQYCEVRQSIKNTNDEFLEPSSEIIHCENIISDESFEQNCDVKNNSSNVIEGNTSADKIEQVAQTVTSEKISQNIKNTNDEFREPSSEIIQCENVISDESFEQNCDVENNSSNVIEGNASADKIEQVVQSVLSEKIAELENKTSFEPRNQGEEIIFVKDISEIKINISTNDTEPEKSDREMSEFKNEVHNIEQDKIIIDQSIAILETIAESMCNHNKIKLDDSYNDENLKQIIEIDSKKYASDIIEIDISTSSVESDQEYSNNNIAIYNVIAQQKQDVVISDIDSKVSESVNSDSSENAVKLKEKAKSDCEDIELENEVSYEKLKQKNEIIKNIDIDSEIIEIDFSTSSVVLEEDNSSGDDPICSAQMKHYEIIYNEDPEFSELVEVELIEKTESNYSAIELKNKNCDEKLEQKDEIIMNANIQSEIVKIDLSCSNLDFDKECSRVNIKNSDTGHKQEEVIHIGPKSKDFVKTDPSINVIKLKEKAVSNYEGVIPENDVSDENLKQNNKIIKDANTGPEIIKIDVSTNSVELEEDSSEVDNAIYNANQEHDGVVNNIDLESSELVEDSFINSKKLEEKNLSSYEAIELETEVCDVELKHKNEIMINENIGLNLIEKENLKQVSKSICLASTAFIELNKQTPYEGDDLEYKVNDKIENKNKYTPIDSCFIESAEFIDVKKQDKESMCNVIAKKVTCNSLKSIVPSETEQNVCFACKRTGIDLIVCSVESCRKTYHAPCFKRYPNIVKSDSNTCPLHICLPCYNMNHKNSQISKGDMYMCSKCPTAFHCRDECFIPGFVISADNISCSKHCPSENKPESVFINLTFCIVCGGNKNLIFCKLCPASVHIKCIKIKSPECYICDRCETRQTLRYNDIVWARVCDFQWWPAEIVKTCDLPNNVQEVPHSIGEFPVKFFGTEEYFWINSRRAYPFVYKKISSEEKVEHKFKKFIPNPYFENALKLAMSATMNKKALRSIESFNTKKLPPYVHIKTNRPVGNVQIYSCLDADDTHTCGCKDSDPNPCGDYTFCLNRSMLHECNDYNCKVGKNCQNRKFVNVQNAPCKPFYTDNRGWGLKAKEDIKCGQFVIEYVGDLIDEEECERRTKQKQMVGDTNFYFCTLDSNRIIDAGPKGNYSRFMNHSCEPNCEMQKWIVNSDPRIGLFARKDIKAGTELTFDYQMDFSRFNKKLNCNCGSARCSGVIGKKPLKGQGITTDFEKTETSNLDLESASTSKTDLSDAKGTKKKTSNDKSKNILQVKIIAKTKNSLDLESVPTSKIDIDFKTNVTKKKTSKDNNKNDLTIKTVAKSKSSLHLESTSSKVELVTKKKISNGNSKETVIVKNNKRKRSSSSSDTDSNPNDNLLVEDLNKRKNSHKNKLKLSDKEATLVKNTKKRKLSDSSFCEVSFSKHKKRKTEDLNARNVEVNVNDVKKDSSITRINGVKAMCSKCKTGGRMIECSRVECGLFYHHRCLKIDKDINPEGWECPVHLCQNGKNISLNETKLNSTERSNTSDFNEKKAVCFQCHTGGKLIECSHEGCGLFFHNFCLRIESDSNLEDLVCPKHSFLDSESKLKKHDETNVNTVRNCISRLGGVKALCFICKTGGMLIRCSREACDYFYHHRCVKIKKDTNTEKWECPAHICQKCENEPYYQCQDCPNSYCQRHVFGRRKSRDKFFCPKHQ
ncbi:uncharacterized protein [Parasteatoda tepidariorum]|uniref:uncharacterized protein n=1 Tax=Parasteatoda tepidariorum TaxID=114398 RepID=UPI001C718755|nr:uncharacterized protein LOC107448625 [Parasteatoda tepidariorum]